MDIIGLFITNSMEGYLLFKTVCLRDAAVELTWTY